MFEKARLKLTFWYLMIIMLVSIFFSLAIYRTVMREIEAGFRRAELRFRAHELGFPPVPRFFLSEELESARLGVIKRLFFANLIIFISAAASGYFLAGKTLSPIRETLEQEKQFVADASHELKTPLTALKTSIEVALRDRKLTLPAARKVLQSSITEVDELSALSENLLSLSSLEKPHNGIRISLLDTAEVFSSVNKRLGPVAAKKGIALIFPTDNIQLKADEDSLIKLLTVLVDNAIKYTSSGGKVSVDYLRQKKQVHFIIEDTGVGIAKKDLPFIFDRFYRADTARTKTGAQGYGLGLSIAKQIVELYHGTIAVESKINKGTTFKVTLPFIS